MPIEKIKEHAHRVKEERERESELLAQADMRCSVDELVERLRSESGAEREDEGRDESGDEERGHE